MLKEITMAHGHKVSTSYIPNTSRTMWDLNYIGKSTLHSSTRIKGTCKKLDGFGGLFFVVVVLGLFVGVLGGRMGGSVLVFLIFFLKCVVLISAKTAAHISEAAWVL